MAMLAALNHTISRLPLKKGHASLGHSSLGKRYTQSHQPIWVAHRSGAHLFVNPREFIGRTVAVTGDYDAAVTDVCTSVLRAGDNVLDIGGHCGVITFACAATLQRLGAGPGGATGRIGVGHIHTFEPNPLMYGLIRRTLAASQARNVTLHTCALSDKRGTFELHMPGGSECEASLEPTAAKSVNGRPAKSALVQVQPAGEYLTRLQLPHVRLLKIDVEGHEPVILRAAEPFLRTTPPDIIVFESHTSRGPFFSRPEVQILASLGYRFHAIERKLFSIRLRPLRTESDLAQAWYDFVAIAPTPGGEEASSRLPH
jgi:FkbM family methyltransferase